MLDNQSPVNLLGGVRREGWGRRLGVIWPLFCVVRPGACGTRRRDEKTTRCKPSLCTTRCIVAELRASRGRAARRHAGCDAQHGCREHSRRLRAHRLTMAPCAREPTQPWRLLACEMRGQLDALTVSQTRDGLVRRDPAAPQQLVRLDWPVLRDAEQDIENLRGRHERRRITQQRGGRTATQAQITLDLRALAAHRVGRRSASSRCARESCGNARRESLSRSRSEEAIRGRYPCSQRMSFAISRPA